MAGMKSLTNRLGWLGGRVETGEGGALADVGDKVVTLSLILRSVRFQREVCAVPCTSIQVWLAPPPEPPDRASLEIALSSPLRRTRICFWLSADHNAALFGSIVISGTPTTGWRFIPNPERSNLTIKPRQARVPGGRRLSGSQKSSQSRDLSYVR